MSNAAVKLFGFDDELPQPEGWQDCGDHRSYFKAGALADPPPEADEQPSPLAALVKDCAVPLKSLADLPDPAPEETNPAALFRVGFFRKFFGAFLVSTSGTGKSVFTIQAAACWAMGKPAFGIQPVRPLHVAIIQAEDDDEEMAYFRNEITGGLVEVSGFDRAEIDDAIRRRVMLPQVIGAVGTAFIGEIGALLAAHPETDLIVVNPFQIYFGGDVSRNAELSEFLRTGLDPLIKPDRAGVLFVHHTNKPPAARSAGLGNRLLRGLRRGGRRRNRELVARHVAVMPTEAAGVFQLTAGSEASGSAGRTRPARRQPSGISPTRKTAFSGGKPPRRRPKRWTAASVRRQTPPRTPNSWPTRCESRRHRLRTRGKSLPNCSPGHGRGGRMTP